MVVVLVRGRIIDQRATLVEMRRVSLLLLARASCPAHLSLRRYTEYGKKAYDRRQKKKHFDEEFEKKIDKPFPKLPEAPPPSPSFPISKLNLDEVRTGSLYSTWAAADNVDNFLLFLQRSEGKQGRELYMDALKALADGGKIAELRKVWTLMRENKLTIDLSCYEIFIWGCLNGKDLRAATLAFQEFQKDKYVASLPTDGMIKHITRLFAHKNDPVGAILFFHALVKQWRVPLEHKRYMYLLSQFARTGHVESALTVFKYMEEDFGRTKGPGAFNLLIETFAMGGNFDLAMTVLQDLKNSGFQATAHTYAGLVKAAFAGNIPNSPVVADKLLRHLEALPVTVCPPSLLPYHELISGLIQLGDTKAALRVQERIALVGLQPSAVTYAKLLKALSHSQDRLTSRALWSEMRAKQIQPNKSCFFSMMYLAYGARDEPLAMQALAWHSCVHT